MDERDETILHREAHIRRLYLLLDSQVDYWRREVAYEVTMAKKYHAAEMKRLSSFSTNTRNSSALPIQKECRK
jgi:hypothetical protein